MKRVAIAFFSLIITNVYPTATHAAPLGVMYASNGVVGEQILAVNHDQSLGYALTNDFLPENFKGDIRWARAVTDWPSFSRDGKIMTFASTRADGTFRVFSLNNGAIKQLTFSKDAPLNEEGKNVDDRMPVVSPDGSKVAFISRREAYLSNPPASGSSIYIASIDGSGLHKLDDLQTNLGKNSADIYSIVWSPDSSLIAFRGKKYMNEKGTNVLRQVLGTIKVSDSSMQILKVFSDLEASSNVDWRGDTIIYGQGGNGQPQNIGVYSLSKKAETILTEDKLQSHGSGEPGAIRLSSDGQSFISLHDTSMTIFKLDGTIVSSLPQRSFYRDRYIWWESAQSYPNSLSLQATVPKVSVKAGGKLTLSAIMKSGKTVINQRGAIFELAPASLAKDPRNFNVSPDGKVSTTKGTVKGNYVINIRNGILNSSVLVTVS